MTHTTTPHHPSPRLDALREGAVREGKRFLPIFAYLWVLFALFALHKNILQAGDNILYGQGFAVINAFVLGKILFFGQMLNLGENFKDRPLIYPVLLKSGLFAFLLLCFHIIEEIIKGLMQGKAVSDSIDAVAGGTLEGIIALGVIVFVALMPFFAFRELTNVIGKRQLHELFFVRRTRLEPVSPASGQVSAGDADNA